MEIAEGFINSSSASKNAYNADPFWEKSESQLLGALIGFVKQVYPKSQQIFSEVLKLLTSQNVRDSQKAKVFFTDFSVKGSALQLWNNYLLAEDKVRANILIGLATKLKLFSIPGLQPPCSLSKVTNFPIFNESLNTYIKKYFQVSTKCL